MSAAEQEAYFNELAELTKVGSIPTMIVDSNLVIRHMTESVYKLFAGYYTLEKKPFFNVFGRVFTQTEIKDFFESIRSREKGWSWIGNMVHKSHTLKTLYTRVRFHPLFDKENRYLLGYWVIIEDTTTQQIEMYKMMLNGLLQASMLKDNDTGNHAQRLNFYCQEFADYLFGLNRYPQITQDFVDNISFLAAIHDDSAKTKQTNRPRMGSNEGTHNKRSAYYVFLSYCNGKRNSVKPSRAMGRLWVSV